MNEKVFSRKKGVVFRRILDEMVLINTKAGEVITLNETGADIWERIDGKKNVGEILDELAQLYDVERNELERDVKNFIEDLLDAGILEEIK